MNALEKWFRYYGGNETEIMNLLQDHGVISDNCVFAEEIGNSFQAITWLDQNRKLWKHCMMVSGQAQLEM